MNLLTEISFDTFSLDKIINGGVIAIIGLLVVFFVLATIWLILLSFNLIFNKLSVGKKKSDEITQNIEPVITAQPKVSDEEIIAVIAAAIAMAESEAPGSTFRVVSFKRV